MIRPDGDKVLLELSFSILKEPDEGPIGFKGVLRDVSERKKTEDEKE